MKEMQPNNLFSRIKLLLEEMEKRINALKKDKATKIELEEISNTLSSAVTKLETSISVIDEKVLLNTQKITSFENSLTDAVSSLETSLSQIDTKTITNADNISNLQNEISTITSDMIDLETLVNDFYISLQNSLIITDNKANQNLLDISYLKDTVEELENSSTQTQSGITNLLDSLAVVATTGDYNDLNNLPTNMCFNTDESYILCRLNVLTIKPSSEYYFICNPDMLIDFEITILTIAEYDYSTTATIDFKINNQIIDSLTYSMEYSTTANPKQFIKFRYFPTQKLNILHLNITNANDYINIYGMIIKMTGHNCFMLQRDSFYNIMCYKNEYYIKKLVIDQGNTSIKTYVLNKNSLEFISENRIFPLIRSGFTTKGLTYKTNGYVEETDNDMTVGYYTYSAIKLYFNHTSSVYQIDSDSLGRTGTMSSFRDINTVGDTNNNYNFPGICTVFNKVPTYIYRIYKQTPLKLNGVNLSPEWVENVGVWQEDMTDVLYYPFRGCMCLRDDGMYFFFPAVDSSYCVQLGFGKNGKIFKRKGSETLYAYVGGMNRVTQYILKQDETGKFYVASQTTKYGLSEYTETLDDIAIIQRGGEIAFVDKLFE